MYINHLVYQPKRIFISVLAIMIGAFVGIGAAPVWSGSTYHNIPGSAFSAFNNAQANALERSHVRIYNPPTNNISLWVIAPIQRVAEDVASSADNVTGYVNAYFSDQSASDAEVDCGIREFSYSSTHIPGGPSDALNVTSTTITRPGIVPGVTFNNWAFADNSASSYVYWTVACKIPPGTGINSVDVLQQ